MPLDILIAAAAGLISVELAVASAIKWIHRRCKWLVTAADLNPSIDPSGLQRFLEHGWDPELGWVRKPNTAHSETGVENATTHYRINAMGARFDPGLEDGPLSVLAYGDSYTFCRQVNDDETWPHYLSELLGTGVANFGVGNYGLDQALLRLEREFDSHPAPLVIIGVVPDTIRRILSVWKHFNEYHNIFAFKPRFRLAEEGLVLLPNPVDSPEKFYRIRDVVESLKRDDFFYDRKFSRDVLRFPYLWSLARSGRRNLPLLAAIILDGLFGGDRTFFLSIRRDVELSARLYREAAPLDLMVAICRRFADFARAKGAVPMVAIMPQKFDLRRIRAGDRYYAPLISRVAADLDVVDLADTLLAVRSENDLYSHDRYGGHLSPMGNRLVAETLAERCREIVARSSIADPASHRKCPPCDGVSGTDNFGSSPSLRNRQSGSTDRVPQ